MNPTVLNYLVLMLYNLHQNPLGTIQTILLTALPEWLVSKAMIRFNLPTVAA